MEMFLQFIVFSFLIESVWENGKMVWQDGKFSFDKFGVLVLACVMAVLLKLDIFMAVKLTEKSMVITQVLTGALFSRGASISHEIIEYLSSIGKQTLAQLK